MIDLLALEWQITEKADKGIHVAPIVRELIAELKEARKERAAVVVWMRERAHGAAFQSQDRVKADALWDAADLIECGEHRREDGK